MYALLGIHLFCRVKGGWAGGAAGQASIMCMLLSIFRQG